jgi:hypothetical protein
MLAIINIAQFSTPKQSFNSTTWVYCVFFLFKSCVTVTCFCRSTMSREPIKCCLQSSEWLESISHSSFCFEYPQEIGAFCIKFERGYRALTRGETTYLHSAGACTARIAGSNGRLLNAYLYKSPTNSTCPRSCPVHAVALSLWRRKHEHCARAKVGGNRDFLNNTW